MEVSAQRTVGDSSDHDDDRVSGVSQQEPVALSGSPSMQVALVTVACKLALIHLAGKPAVTRNH